MEKRRHKRVYIHQQASISVDDQTIAGYIENISESGIGYLMSSPGQFKDDFLINKTIEVHVQIQPDKMLDLMCVAIWAKRGVASSKTIGVGMSVIDPPHEFIDWVKTLPGDITAG